MSIEFEFTTSSYLERKFVLKTLSRSSKIDFLTFTFMVLYHLSVFSTV